MDNLAEKVDDCPLERGSLSIVCVPLGPRKLSVMRSSGVSAIQGIEVNGRIVGTFRIVRYIVGVRC